MSTPLVNERRPDLRAHEQSIRLPLPQLVGELRSLLGARLVAYLGAVKSTRQVAEWVSGNVTPSAPVRDRLRAAYQIASTLSEREEPSVVQAWFQGMNPKLDDVSPARFLRENTGDEAASRVMGAARSFLAS